MYEVLKNIGLTDNESKAYLALLELGVTTTGKVAKQADIDRSNAYYSLERLKKKGLVSEIINKKTKHYEAANPSVLKGLLEEKEQRLEEIMPQLLLTKKLSKSREQQTTSYESLKTLKEVLITIAEKNKELLIVGSGNDSVHLKHFYIRFERKLEEQKNCIKRIYQKLDVTMFISKEDLLLVDWEKPHITHVQNKKIAESYRKMFISFPSWQPIVSSSRRVPYLSNQERVSRPQIYAQQVLS